MIHIWHVQYRVLIAHKFICNHIGDLDKVVKGNEFSIIAIDCCEAIYNVENAVTTKKQLELEIRMADTAMSLACEHFGSCEYAEKSS
ncbi:hypothetical protein VNO78_27674 [Psophocarpus tetragonolobus]|uniref:Uncharacterized protein n=1 Tax=Psophocarpus tetragonolobus TaxID=3891 RepID=A0AAN9S1T0_PSOTE